ncbi:MAG TPA: CoA-binding protein [Bacteroidales bacterium]|jgi:predicted CoA-binding protein|nr:CoA-binding protein [Bacteroidales bacterium]HNV95251.1 CoA-binding protein [Bacteroidales bacterium]
MKTVVLGASPNPERFSYKAIVSLTDHHHEVVAIGKRKGNVAGIEIIQETPLFTDVHTIAMYLSPENQKEYYDYILSLNPKRIIFNPGTENNELYKLAEEKGIEVVEWCVLVMLSVNRF